MISQGLSPKLSAFAEREFLGERLIWAEKPDHRIKILLSFGIWIFAIPWTAFALFWESMVAGPLLLTVFGYEVSGNLPGTTLTVGMIVMALFGLPFIAIGVGMLLTPFWTMRKATRTYYVLTNKRLTRLEDGHQIKIINIAPRDIISISRKEGPDGRGTVMVHMGFIRDCDGDKTARSTELGVINNVREVERLIQNFKDSTNIAEAQSASQVDRPSP